MYLIYDKHGVIAESDQRFVHVESERNFRSHAAFKKNMWHQLNNILVNYCKNQKLF